jgi:hypothetical protein
MKCQACKSEGIRQVSCARKRGTRYPSSNASPDYGYAERIAKLTDIKQLGHDYNRERIGPAKSQAHGGQSLQMQVSADMKNKLRALAGDPELRRMPVAWSVNASPGRKASGITAARRGSVVTSMPQANLLVNPRFRNWIRWGLSSVSFFAVTDLNETSKYHHVDLSVTVAIVFSGVKARAPETFCR